MNKLLQHIIDAGDVNHKMLPKLAKAQKGIIVPPISDLNKYDNIPNPVAIRANAERLMQFKKAEAARLAAERQGSITQAAPKRSVASKTWAIATNPMTALSYKAKGLDIPENFERGSRNSLDMAVDIINPFGYAEAARSIPSDVVHGNLASAGLKTAALLPILSELRGVKNFIPKVNPWSYQNNLPQNVMYRGIGRAGMEDALQSGVFRANPNVEPIIENGFDMSKQFSKAYFSPKFNVADQYGQGFIAEVPRDATTWGNRYGRGKTWSQIAQQDIPVDQGRILQKDWLMGYKPVNMPSNVQTFGPGNSNSGLLNYLKSTSVNLNPLGVGIDYIKGAYKGLFNQYKGLLNGNRRPYFEAFPVTEAQKAKIMGMQDDAMKDALDFTKNYWYENGSSDIRPILENKIREILPELKMASNKNNLERTIDGVPNPLNPFTNTADRLIPSTSWGKGREGLSEEIISELASERGLIGGLNLKDEGLSLTLRNNGRYYKSPKEIANIVAHESGHTAQNFGVLGPKNEQGIQELNKTWGEVTTKFDPEYNYATSNPDTELGRRFKEALVEPYKTNNPFNTQTWRSSPNELHSQLMAGKYNLYKQALRQGMSSEEAMERATNPLGRELNWLLENKDLNRHFKPTTSHEEKLNLLKLLPALAPVAAGAALSKERYGGESNMFGVFAEDGVEYKGPSIVDYLATKGYSGSKAFRKGLAEKYGVEDYNYSAAKNTELLNKLRENDDLLEKEYEQTQAPISAEKIMQMEQEAQNAAPRPQQQVVRNTQPLYRPSFMDMEIPKSTVNTSLKPKVIYDKFSLTPKMVIPMPLEARKSTAPATPTTSAPVTTAPVQKVRVVSAPQQVRPTQRPVAAPTPSVQIPSFNPYAFLNTPANTNGELLKAKVPAFDPYAFLKNASAATQRQVIPANKPAVTTKKFDSKEAADDSKPWYSQAWDAFEQAVAKSPLDFSKMTMSQSGFTPEGTKAMAKDLAVRTAGLFSPEKGKLVENYFKRQDLKNNPNLQETKTKFNIPTSGRPAISTGDTINIDKNRYVIPAMIDLNQTNWGVRNRDEYKDINTEAADITTFQSFENAKDYFTKNPKDAATSTYIGVDPSGKVKVGNKADFLNSNYRITKTFGNKIVDFVDEANGSMKLKNSSSKASNKHLSPVVKVLGDDGKMTEGSMNLLIPKGNRDTKSFGQITGGRVIFKTPKGEQFLVSGSAEDIRNAFKQIKGDNPYVEAVTLDNGSYAMGLRNKNQKITAQELKDYQGANTTGSAFLYLQPGNYTRGTNAGAPKFQFKDIQMNTPNIRTKNDESFKKGHPLTNEQKAIILHHTGYSDTTGVSKGMSKAMQGVARQFSQPGESSHVVIDFDGTRYNYARPDQVTFHAGKSMFNGRDNVNDFGVGIEFQGDTDKTRLTDKQINSFVEYAGPIIKKNKIPLSSIITHKQIRTNYMKANPQDKQVLGKPDVNEIDYKRIIQALKKKGFYAQGGPVVDPMGQWAHPGKVTRIPGSDITMQGVPYPVLGVGSNGQKQMMYPGQEYSFGGAEHVDEYPMMGNGGYTVVRSHDRKGKTHKVTGPDGTVKYFGDSKLGQHPKDPERKKAFYARHKKNLAANPYFRAFARATWQTGGQIDYMQGGGLWDTDKVAYLDSTVNANKNLEFIRRAMQDNGPTIPTPKDVPGYKPGQTSSHLMTYDPKSARSYPEVVNMNGILKYLTGDAAYNYAEDTGEYIQFPTAQQAEYFSQNYKKSNYIKVGKQPLEKKHGIKVNYKK